MKLKKLELIGFKSFYDKTTFDFSAGVTAIVGPNGCGKSNIVDAIRWVLGEHTPSYIRSKALEDVIFAGSDAAGPLGMAEVTLTFVNDDGNAPPGYESYAEIAITRRAFRDGESEFSINKVPCRMKDIVDLFLDTGAGARGYAIIAQGKVAEIVEARPDDIRLIIEEAAGVAKFRIRRKEAERKMESTRQNLARVKDILDEVRRQIGSLERQVRKAERYKSLRSELRGLDLRIAARKLREMTLARDAARGGLREIEDGLLAARTDLARFEADREEVRTALAEMDRHLADLREEYARGKEEAARLEAQWGGLRGQAERVRRMAAEAAAEIASVDAGIVAIGERLAEAEAESVRRAGDLAAARLRLDEENAALSLAREEHRVAREAAERAKSDLMVHVSRHSDARSAAESLSQRITEGERNLARIAERIGEAAEAVRKASSDFDAAAAAESSAREQLAAAEKSWEEAGAAFASANTRLDASVEAARLAESGLASAEMRLSTLSRLQERRDWASSGVRAVLRHFRGDEAAESPERGIFGVMGEMIDTDAAYEKAVEAVLGERMQSVVVRDLADGISAVRYLKESREGRGAFVPVGLRARNDRLAYVGEEGVVAPLTEVVSAPEECRELVQSLLGGTLLVRSLDTAIRLWNRNGVWNSYVTLDGEVVTADGILIGGEQGGGEAGILARKREIRELEREIDVLRKERDRRASAAEEARRERASLEERLADRFRRREEARTAHVAAERGKAVLAETLSQARVLLEGRTREEAFLRGEQERMAADHAVLVESALESGHVRGEEEERARILQSVAESKRMRVDEVLDRAHAAEVLLRGLEEMDRAAAAARASLLEQVEGKRKLLSARSLQKEEQERDAAAIEESMRSIRDAIEQGAASLTRLQERIEERIAEREGCSSRLSETETSLRDARRRESEWSERQAAERLRLQRFEMDIAALDALVHQRYEVHLSDLPVEESTGAEGDAASDLPVLESRAEELRERIASMGDVNLASLEEHRDLTERFSFLASQKEDLDRSLEDLSKAIQRINRTTRERFSKALEDINGKFSEVFPRLFQGGRAELRLVDPENLLESGIGIFVQPPGKKPLPLGSLSGGEKALTAISLIFSIFLVKPSPFCLLDEVDAPLDDANVDRFNALVREMSQRYQYLLITHNKRTMELADVLYGITMEKHGISRTVSVRLNH
ncbi:MAG: chromosome segregation protein SMC [Deltaproteobacteria bacterium]